MGLRRKLGERCRTRRWQCQSRRPGKLCWPPGCRWKVQSQLLRLRGNPRMLSRKLAQRLVAPRRSYATDRALRSLSFRRAGHLRLGRMQRETRGVGCCVSSAVSVSTDDIFDICRHLCSELRGGRLPRWRQSQPRLSISQVRTSKLNSSECLRGRVTVGFAFLSGITRTFAALAVTVEPPCGGVRMPLSGHLHATELGCIRRVDPKHARGFWPCRDRYETCGGTACIDLATDPNHCGTCGVACPAGSACAGGQCMCAGGLELCDGKCVDGQSDLMNCGKCGHVCSTGSLCNVGQCSCPGGLEACGNACVGTKFDAANCGGCGQACAQGKVCLQGSCADGCGVETQCGSSCVDAKSNPLNCGGCGKILPGWSLLREWRVRVSCGNDRLRRHASIPTRTRETAVLVERCAVQVSFAMLPTVNALEAERYAEPPASMSRPTCATAAHAASHVVADKHARAENVSARLRTFPLRLRLRQFWRVIARRAAVTPVRSHKQTWICPRASRTPIWLMSRPTSARAPACVSCQAIPPAAT